MAITRITTGESSLPQARSGGPKRPTFLKRSHTGSRTRGQPTKGRKVAEPLPPDYLLRSSPRVCSLVSHVRLGFQQRCLSRSLIVCRDLQGCSQGAEETAHLRDVWHHLAVVDAYL